MTLCPCGSLWHNAFSIYVTRNRLFRTQYSHYNYIYDSGKVTSTKDVNQFADASGPPMGLKPEHAKGFKPRPRAGSQAPMARRGGDYVANGKGNNNKAKNG